MSKKTWLVLSLGLIVGLLGAGVLARQGLRASAFDGAEDLPDAEVE